MEEKNFKINKLVRVYMIKIFFKVGYIFKFFFSVKKICWVIKKINYFFFYLIIYDFSLYCFKVFVIVKNFGGILEYY